MAQTNYFDFGYKGRMEEVGTENAKKIISDFFGERTDAKIAGFVGNSSPPPGDIMRVEVRTTGGTAHIVEDLKGEFRYGADLSFVSVGPRLKK